MDPREKMALMAILKSAVLILSLLIAIFLLKKGIGLYEESIWINNTTVERSPVLREVELVEEFDIQDQDAREQFAKRIEHWKEADRLVRSADVLLQRNIYDQAIKQCQDALRRDPAHLGALERLGKLYYANGDYVESVNAYIRLLSVDPSREETQKRLIEALDAFGDYQAVKYMAEWYLDENMSDIDVERYLANAHYALEDFEAAAEAYDRILREGPKNIPDMEKQAAAYMQIKQYEKAMVTLEKLRDNNPRNPLYFKQIAICQAQLRQGQETAYTLLRAGQLFGRDMVLVFVRDPLLDPVREERAFQAFIDRFAGSDYRQGIEELMTAKKPVVEKDVDQVVEPQLKIPVSEIMDKDLLKLEE